jgi:streptogramin lyase
LETLLGVSQVLDQDLGPDGTLWIATTEGLVHWHAEFDTHDLYPISARAVAVAPDGALWVGVGGTVMRFNGREFEIIGDCDNDLAVCGNILDIAFTTDGTAWIANGFTLAHYDGLVWGNYDMLANSVVVGPDDSIWVNGWEGTQGSFYTTHLDGSDWIFYPLRSLPGPFRVEVVTEGGLAWSLAEQNGVVSFDGETWTEYPLTAGFDQAYPATLGVDPEGVLWLVGSESIAVLDRLSSPVATWTTYEIDLSIAPFHPGLIDFAPDGAAWLATTRFDPHQASSTTVSSVMPTITQYLADYGLADPIATPSLTPTLSMKGYELYSWQVNGSWYFALLIGTNRIKTLEEIVASSIRLESLEALQAKLDQLHDGEQVFWLADRVSGMALPPEEMIDAVAAHCSYLGVNLEIVR